MDKQEEPNNGGSSGAITTRHNEPYTGLTAVNLFDENKLQVLRYFSNDLWEVKKVVLRVLLMA